MIFPRSAKWTGSLLTGAALVVVSLTGCAGAGDKGAVTPKGTVSLDELKVGIPESLVQEAVLTFVKDDKPQAKAGGKSQYLSRTKDSRGGQYIAQCKDGNCYLMQAYYSEAPITKDQALETIKAMLPQVAPPQSKVDDSQVTQHKDMPKERIFYGEDYVAEIVYNDKDATKVAIVNVFDVNKTKNKLADNGDAKDAGDASADKKASDTEEKGKEAEKASE
ncbi:MAG: hypothetical protein K2Z81_22065 [Cyanobacteria bacterium]|nr:hypothetical protein [Cyanobacteriota bacterium]